jgi:hypothetical protein
MNDLRLRIERVLQGLAVLCMGVLAGFGAGYSPRGGTRSWPSDTSFCHCYWPDSSLGCCGGDTDMQNDFEQFVTLAGLGIILAIMLSVPVAIAARCCIGLLWR